MGLAADHDCRAVGHHHIRRDLNRVHLRDAVGVQVTAAFFHEDFKADLPIRCHRRPRLQPRADGDEVGCHDQIAIHPARGLVGQLAAELNVCKLFIEHQYARGREDTVLRRIQSPQGVGGLAVKHAERLDAVGFSFWRGDRLAIANNGDCNAINGQIKLRRTKGATGIYANQAKVTCNHFQIATTDRWETLEKLEVTIDGVTKRLGQIERKGYAYDEYGYLVYSGLDERETRVTEKESVSLDYETMVIDIPAWTGAKEINVKFRDAGVWFGECFIGDKEGCSVIWTGDAQSF